MEVSEKKLPLEDLNLSDLTLQRFKEECLDKPTLTEKELSEIIALVERKDSSVYQTCDEYHPHSYFCVSFNHPVSAVVFRLVDEIRKYQRKIEKIKEISKAED